jgi:hypothetical protein
LLGLLEKGVSFDLSGHVRLGMKCSESRTW